MKNLIILLLFFSTANAQSTYQTKTDSVKIKVNKGFMEQVGHEKTNARNADSLWVNKDSTYLMYRYRIPRKKSETKLIIRKQEPPIYKIDSMPSTILTGFYPALEKRKSFNTADSVWMTQDSTYFIYRYRIPRKKQPSI